MQNELYQFEKNQIWDFVPKLTNISIIGIKQVFRNKLDESGIAARNKARLVVKRYNQEDGIDFNETLDQRLLECY